MCVIIIFDGIFLLYRLFNLCVLFISLALSESPCLAPSWIFPVCILHIAICTECCLMVFVSAPFFIFIGSLFVKHVPYWKYNILYKKATETHSTDLWLQFIRCLCYCCCFFSSHSVKTDRCLLFRILSILNLYFIMDFYNNT